MQDNSNKLVRTVGFWGLVAMCINAVVGSGVFLLPHESFKHLGAFSLWAPLLFAVPVFILVLCFAEAASHFEQPGGAYLYAKTAFGDFVGFETGWMNWIARVTSLASLSNGFVVALSLLFPGIGEGMPRAIVITATILILATIHFLGVKYGAASIYVFTLGKVIPLVGFIILALVVWRSNPIPASLTLPGAGTNWPEAILFMLFAYAGFENLGVPAGEFKNPRRDLPLALLVGTFAIASMYVLVQLGAMSALPDLSQSTTPIASAAAAIIGPAGAIIVTIGALLSMAGTNSGTMLEGSRMLYALSLGRRMGPISYVHPTFRTPSVAIVIHAGVALALALPGSFAKLALLSAVARLVTYLVTCCAVPRLRKLNEGFRTPGLIVPILGVLVSLAFVYVLDAKRLIAAAIALTVGAILYLLSRPKGASGAAVVATIALVFLTGCRTHVEQSRAHELARVAKDWCLTIRASQVLPVYPLTEDLQVGDVLLVSSPLEEEVKELERAGFLPLENVIARLHPSGWQSFYQGSYAVTNGSELPKQWQFPQPPTTPPGTAWAIAPGAAFPSYTFQVKKGVGATLAIPIQSVPVGLSLLQTGDASGTVNISQASTYGLPVMVLSPQVDTWAAENREFLRQYGPHTVTDKKGRTRELWNYVRVVNRVYVAGGVNVSLISNEATGARIDAGASKPAALFDAGQSQDAADAARSYSSVLSSISQSVAAASPGANLSIASASARSVAMNETFPRPLVIGFLAFDRIINEDGSLGPPIPTHARVTEKTVPSGTVTFVADPSATRIRTWLAADPANRAKLNTWLSANVPNVSIPLFLNGSEYQQQRTGAITALGIQ